MDSFGPTGVKLLVLPDFVWRETAKIVKRMKRQLVLNKGTEKFIFRYDAGSEDTLLDALIEHVKDDKTDFDWFDAAVLSFKLTQSLIGQADELLQERDQILQEESQ